MKNVVIIGGGASALFCACFIKDDINVTIIEQNLKLGKKILATGNGRCNLSNLNIDKNLSFGLNDLYNQGDNLKKYFKQFSVKDTLNFFDKIGLKTYSDEEGRIYPISNMAQSVLDSLTNYLKYNKKIKYINEKVINIKKENKFVIQTENLEICFDSVIVATGNSTDLNLYKKLDIKTKNFVPSLCSLKTQKIKSLSGIRCDNVKVFCKELNFEEEGEILFKDEGISGIVIFNLSTKMARLNNFKHEIYIDFFPSISYENILSELNKRKLQLSNYKIYDFLTGIFHKNISIYILDTLKIDKDKTVQCLTLSQIQNIAKFIKQFKLITNGYYMNNQVYSGGICLDDLDEKLQCKNIKNLFFIGEAVDVDGICGGYNLQWAWTSGYIVGKTYEIN